ncbi:hypothetical protein NP493_941g01062 [Ridgeia piscesae]|uniref:Uncharacterized protein n=1 Tax=Ridgeia piscesae TaxID=27915 RepID=A0AAD9KJZ4_RIDPI|nr:hypothetical protein NP493_941g01062 [Ridgeia piscesae]
MEPILVQPIFETENISDKLFSPLSLRHIRAVNIKERVRLNDVRRDIDLACKMTVFEIDHATKSMRKRQERLRAQIELLRGRTAATPGQDGPNSGGTGPDKRSRKAANVITFSGEDAADDNKTPKVTADENGHVLPVIVVQSPDGTANRALSPETRDDHETNGGDGDDDSSRLLAAILRADDAEQQNMGSLHVPAMMIDPKGRFVEVTEGDYESTNSLAGALSRAARHPDTTHMSVDAYQKMRMLRGEKHDSISGEKTQKNGRSHPERSRQTDMTQAAGDADRKTGAVAHQAQYSDGADTGDSTDYGHQPMLSHNMFSLPPLYSLKPGRHRWRDLSGTVTSDHVTAVPQLRDVKWCRYLRYPSGKGRPSDVPSEYA